MLFFWVVLLFFLFFLVHANCIYISACRCTTRIVLQAGWSSLVAVNIGVVSVVVFFIYFSIFRFLTQLQTKNISSTSFFVDEVCQNYTIEWFIGLLLVLQVVFTWFYKNKCWLVVGWVIMRNLFTKSFRFHRFHRSLLSIC